MTDADATLKKYHDGEASRLAKYARNTGMEMPAKYADGGGVKGRGKANNITIIIGKDQKPDPSAGIAALAAASRPKPPPVVLPPPAAPGGGGPPMAGAGGPGLPGGTPMPGMKRGGRATALPMTAGAISGEGRLQKTASQAKAAPKKKA
jgi:hypothetical protein